MDETHGHLDLQCEEIKQARIDDEVKIEVVIRVNHLSEFGGGGDVLSYKVLSYPDSISEAYQSAKRTVVPYPS